MASTITCDCDFDYTGDPGYWRKRGKCALHDECEGCMEIQPSTKMRNGEWLCDECAALEVK